MWWQLQREEPAITENVIDITNILQASVRSEKYEVEISKKEKESQKHNEHVHYLGSSGYASKRTKWSIDDPIASLNDPDCSNLSMLSTECTGRGFDWLRARARADGQGGHYFPNKKTKDNELHNQASEGSWTPQGHDDLLARALGNKEHGGRVRGVGGGVKIKDVFKSGPRRHSGLVSTDELATITEEIRKKVQKECEEMMNSKLEGIFNQLKQMGVSLEANQFVNDAGARKVDNARSSCHSVDPEDYFSTIKVPTLCRLCVIHVERGKVVAARGTLFPTNQGEMIHNNPIAPQNVRVSVNDVITEYQLTPLPVPCYEHETIGNAVGSFVQWPKDLVMLGQDPILEKKKLHEMTPIQKSSKVENPSFPKTSQSFLRLPSSSHHFKEEFGIWNGSEMEWMDVGCMLDLRLVCGWF
ncbi:hypothetical protein AgCh_005450 [Apium graveolens]